MSTDPKKAPSKARLAERTARVEEKVDHIDETTDRIEEKIDENLAELELAVEENERRVDRFWSIYRLSRWGIPIAVSAGTAAATYLLF